MGSQPSSIVDSPAGLSIAGKIYQTTGNVLLSCMGWSLYEDDVLEPICISLTRPYHYCHNIGGFCALIRPGVRIKLLDFQKGATIDCVYYSLKFTVLDDIPLSQIAEYDDYNRGQVSSSNILLGWVDNDYLRMKGTTVYLSPYDFFDFSTKDIPMNHMHVLRIVDQENLDN